MKIAKSFCLLVALSSPLVSGQGVPGEKVKVGQASHFEQFSGVVERVFKVEDDGFTSISYEVVWRGKSIVVDDPIKLTNLAVGDKIQFMAMWHEMAPEHGSKKLLHFTITPRPTEKVQESVLDCP